MIATRRDGFDSRLFWYDGKSTTFLEKSKKLYSIVDASNTISEMLEMLRAEYGVTLPLTDFLRKDFVEMIQPLLMKARHDGWENILGDDTVTASF